VVAKTVGRDHENATAPTERELDTTTPDISGEAGRTRARVQAVEDAVDEIKDNIREIKADQKTDFRIIIGMFSAGFLIVGGMLIFGYFRLDDRIGRSDDKINSLTSTTVRIETKLEDLLARIPPAQTPIPSQSQAPKR